MLFKNKIKIKVIYYTVIILHGGWLYGQKYKSSLMEEVNEEKRNAKMSG